MWQLVLGAVLATLLSSGLERTAYALATQEGSQITGATTILVGTWRSAGFAYQFKNDGSYVYAGTMGTNAMRTQISEEGTYSVSGDQLIVKRRSGLITNTQNYKQTLGPEKTVFHWRLVNSQSGPAVQLVFPNGGIQIFYKQ
jgi:hypothetical protein